MTDSGFIKSQRFFSSDPKVGGVAQELYGLAAGLPILSPHGHVDAALFVDPDFRFGSPAELFIMPDHYVTRMLFSQGIPFEQMGIGRGPDVQSDHREIWRLFCRNFTLFRGTPSGIWLQLELSEVFGISEKPDEQNADKLYDLISEKLASAQFSPRALFDSFNLEVLCTTDAATDELLSHQALRIEGWQGRVLPTFRPDALIDLTRPNWRTDVDLLGHVSGERVGSFAGFIRALEQRRVYFKQMGAVACDHGVLSPAAESLSPVEAEGIFQRALQGDLYPDDAARFTAHMIMEMARMSCEDGLVMQLHCGVLRNHSTEIHQKYGPDRGADIPVQVEFTRNLLPLLNRFGTNPNLTLILFTLDESAYSRELAPLAGFYPVIKLGPPWWFHDSLNGIARYFDQVMDTAGLQNTAGFNDDTRAFCSIPARHEAWRRSSANWLAGLVVRHIIDMQDAREMIVDLASGLARKAYKL